MVEMFPLKSSDAAYGKISGMISTLGDPFTRIINPKVTPPPNNANLDLSFVILYDITSPILYQITRCITTILVRIRMRMGRKG
jgi:hypothetical protein